ncbi:MAG: T9SS type A sorting domain-containing protein, partial [Ferruginibacter sp.]
ATYTINGVNGETGATVGTINVSGTTHTPAGTYNGDIWSFVGNSNYNTASGTVNDVIGKRPITITPNAGQFKYCGQPDPTFTYSQSEVLLTGNSFTGMLGRVTTGTGPYLYTLGGLTAGPNYTLSLGGSNTFEIKSVNIDASASGTAVILGTASTTLSATVTSGGTLIPGSSVTFNVTNGSGAAVGVSVTGTTGSNGIATAPFNTSGLPVGLYAVNATAGSGCTTTVNAYFSVYDPNAGFVTGGGWINSPAGAYSTDITLVGKANFGFNAQYKKGNTTPDGNTQFQFQAGNLNFKSSIYNSGSLVIAGAKAIFQGTGTINGTGTYNFMISAIDGTISGGGGVDRFRIKIWSNADGSGVIYDNNQLNANNADPTTALGGGSIVIHSTSKSARTIAVAPSAAIESLATKFTAKVLPNPSHNQFTFLFTSPSNEVIKMNVLDYNGRLIEQSKSISPKQLLQIGQQYRPGVYYAEFIQGSEKIIIKLIKEAN